MRSREEGVWCVLGLAAEGGVVVRWPYFDEASLTRPVPMCPHARLFALYACLPGQDLGTTRDKL